MPTLAVSERSLFPDPVSRASATRSLVEKVPCSLTPAKLKRRSPVPQVLTDASDTGTGPVPLDYQN